MKTIRDINKCNTPMYQNSQIKPPIPLVNNECYIFDLPSRQHLFTQITVIHKIHIEPFASKKLLCKH